MIDKEYIKTIRERKTKSRVYAKHQLVGLSLATLLEDQAHKTLYIKIAKECPHQTLFEIAGSVIEKKSIQNRGAYFMKVLKERGLFDIAKKFRKPKQTQGKLHLRKKRDPRKK